jgi:rhodanese-related sulfurtransferase
VPGAELVLRVHDIAPSPDTLVVINCAGRTRSIIGAQSLINAGIPNKVVALRNGTMGWHLAGLTCDHGKDERAPALSEAGAAVAKAKAAAVAQRFGIAHTDDATLARWRNDDSRTLYVFDVRDPAEYAAGHLPGALSAPGGQLVQATDTYAGTLGARIVLCDDCDVRAVMTASWLKLMGWKDVAVLAKAGTEAGWPCPEILGNPPDPAAAIDVAALAVIAAKDDVAVLDLSRSSHYRRGHIPGAWFAIRSRLDIALARIGAAREIILTSEDGVLAGLAVAEARGLGKARVRWLKGGNAAWKAGGHPLSTEPKMADEAIDVWLKPYEQPGDNEAAMNAYLSWEIDLLDRIERDGTCNFAHAP